jgi:hypothetical protein
MRLDCVTLWIDDQPTNIASTQQNFEARVNKLGFEALCKTCTSIDGASKYLADSIFQDSVDLIFVDFDLGNNVFGDTALQQIRRVLPYKDILFYSAIDLKILLNKASQAGVDGIFCSSRNELSEKGYSIFENLVKKVLDIDHTRGIIMGATADIDVVMKDCIRKIHSKCGLQCTCTHKIQSKICVEKEILCKKSDIALGYTDFSSILDDDFVWSSYLLVDLLIDLLDKNTFSIERDLLIKYKHDILPKRNQLAHVRLKPDGGAVFFEDSPGSVINEGLMRDLRCQLIEHRKNIRQLASKLGVQKSLLFSLERGGVA